MIRKFSILLICISLFSFLACEKTKTAENPNSNTSEVKKGIAPVADNEIAVIEMEKPVFGTIKIELYSNIAPKMVARFKELAKEGFYNGVTFHRINDSVIQGGDPLSKDNNPKNDGTGNSDKLNVPAEFSDVPYNAGIVGAARMPQNVNSQNSQFFIMLKREPQFNENYTVFGKVIEGMSNVRTISGVNPKEGERPLENVVIKSITIVPKQ
ncbi:N/A [soil metagenome]|jgi:cyclophilin family peptidyl-prolyl cis-trans isomerase|nr:peptidylprolyl isomerase [Acidobacteriota bacterium]